MYVTEACLLHIITDPPRRAEVLERVGDVDAVYSRGRVGLGVRAEPLLARALDEHLRGNQIYGHHAIDAARTTG